LSHNDFRWEQRSDSLAVVLNESPYLLGEAARFQREQEKVAKQANNACLTHPWPNMTPWTPEAGLTSRLFFG